MMPTVHVHVYTGSKAPPPGAVAVLPPGGVPLLKTSKEGEIINEVYIYSVYIQCIYTVYIYSTRQKKIYAPS